MCFLLRHPKQRAKTAKEDIIVYKFLKRGCYAPCQDHYKYDNSVQPIVKLRVSRPVSIVEQGYHAYVSFYHAMVYYPCPYEHCLWEFRIPKGTKYYENGIEIVAETCQKLERVNKRKVIREA